MWSIAEVNTIHCYVIRMVIHMMHVLRVVQFPTQIKLKVMI